MKKLNHRPAEPELFIEALDAIPEQTIFVKKDDKVVGVIEPYPGRGCYICFYSPRRLEYYTPTAQGTIAQAEKDGYEFFINL
jgi:hypothetical protein